VTQVQIPRALIAFQHRSHYFLLQWRQQRKISGLSAG